MGPVTPDGRPLLHSAGSGPGLVVVHGSAVTAADYAGLAAALADRFTVHRYDRRGRSGPVAPDQGIATDVADLRAVLRHTGARLVLGHSYGGLVALRAATGDLAVDRIAVYDPAVSIEGGFPSAYVEPFAAAAAAGDVALALALLSHGLGSVGRISTLPVAVQRMLARVFARTPPGRVWRERLPGAVVEARQVAAHDGPASAYAGITAQVRVLTGAASPAYFGAAAAALAAAVPGARHLVVAGADHDAALGGAPAVVAAVAEFLGGSWD